MTQPTIPIPGIAIPILDAITFDIAFFAAADDSPSRLPFESKTGIPSRISLQKKIYKLIRRNQVNVFN